MKTRQSLVSNSSSSSFVLKKSEFDLDHFRNFLKRTNNIYSIITDDPEYIDELINDDDRDNGRDLAENYVIISTMGDDIDYPVSHFMVRLYMKRFGMKDYSDEKTYYRGDGRFEEDEITEEMYDEIESWFCK